MWQPIKVLKKKKVQLCTVACFCNCQCRKYLVVAFAHAEAKARDVSYQKRPVYEMRYTVSKIDWSAVSNSRKRREHTKAAGKTQRGTTVFMAIACIPLCTDTFAKQLKLNKKKKSKQPLLSPTSCCYEILTERHVLNQRHVKVKIQVPKQRFHCTFLV